MRIGLRDYRSDDADKVVEWINNTDITQWFTFADSSLSKKDIEIFVKKQISNTLHKPSFKNFVLFDVIDANKGYIGSVGLKNINYISNRAEITIVISDKRYIGKGYGQEALELICKYGFFQLALSEIEIHCIAENARAIKAYEKFGFVHKKRLKSKILKLNEYHDEIIMSLSSDMFEHRINPK